MLEDEDSDEEEEVATDTREDDNAMDADLDTSQPAAKGQP